MRKPFWLSLLVIAVFSGCSNLTILRTRELQAVRERADSLYAEITALQMKLLEEQKANSELLRLLRADQQLRFEEIERKVSQIENNLNENQSRLSSIDEKTTEINNRFQKKLEEETEPAVRRKLQSEWLFEVAMEDFNAGRYDLALNGFRQIVGSYPDAPLSPEAEYWVGECHYAKKEYQSAEKVYMEIIRKYPQGTRFCVTLYKLGLIYDHQKKLKSRDLVWKNLLEQCAASEEAKMAEKRMNGK